jgi:FixJ family two-component response regulator
MNDAAITVFVVDDDASVLQALSRLLRAEGYAVRECPSPAAFLEQHDHDHPGCVVLDLSMPGLSGLEVQTALAAGGERPVVFITGHGDVPSSVQAMKAGAVDFLMKPFDDVELLRAVRSAVDRDLRRRAERAERADLERLLATLTPREREVLLHVVSGRINKRIAADLGTVEKTIKVHRARIMEKLRVNSVAELTRLCERAGLGSGSPAQG